MNKQQIKRLARQRAGLILESVMNGWTPEDLIDRYGQNTVDMVAEEIFAIANRLLEQSGDGS